MSTAQKYRKKPVTVEAMKFDGTSASATAIDAWIGVEDDGCTWGDVQSGYMVETLEGTMTARPGDYVIRGVQGEFYPCKPDIFAATYDAA